MLDEAFILIGIAVLSFVCGGYIGFGEGTRKACEKLSQK